MYFADRKFVNDYFCNALHRNVVVNQQDTNALIELAHWRRLNGF